MNLTTLDLDTLRTLVTANDLGGYGQAGLRLGRTPSAISLQMKRLQTDMGVPLFRKRGRGLALTEAGESVLRYARRMLELNDELVDTVRGGADAGRLVIGFSQDFAETLVPDVLARFSRLHPAIQIEVRIEGNAALVDAVEKGEIDAALAIGQADRKTAETLGRVELTWIAGRDFKAGRDQPLPLLLLGSQCAFRKEAIRLLDQAGLPWRIAALSPSVNGLWATALGGLGLTLRTNLGLPAGLASGKRMFGLPSPGSFPVTFHRLARAPGQAVERLHAIVTERIGEGRYRTRRQTEMGIVPSGVATTR